MSASVKVIVKNSDIDGKPITWNVLAITSYIGGDFQTLELKLTKTEALLANMLLGSNEEKPSTIVRKATDEEAPKVTKNKTILDEDDEETEWPN